MEYVFEKAGKNYKVQFQPYEEQDFSNYLQCIKSFYKEGYPYKEYLDKDVVQQKIANKEMILNVGKLEDGTLICISAASIQSNCFKNSILLMLRNVIFTYSGVGVASMHMNHMVSLLQEEYPDAESVYADVMTYNGVSQHSLVSRGYVLCGIRFMVYKNEIIVPKLSYEKNTKMTQSVYCLNLKKGIHKKIYVPIKYMQIIQDIYEQLDVNVECHGFDENSMNGMWKDTENENNWHMHILREHESVEWVIQSVGEDFAGEMDEMFQEYEKFKNRSAIAYINMSHPSCSWAWDYFVKKGFYFSGIKPLNLEGEYIILSHTEYCNERYQDIVLGEGGEKLLNYILDNK